MEYSMWWAFKLIHFDDDDDDGDDNDDNNNNNDKKKKKGPGDAIQSRQYPKGTFFFFEDPEYDGESGLEYLCSNGCVEMPNTTKADWIYCENPEARNLTPTTITRIREWLYGVPFFASRSDEILSDLELMHLVFCSMGSPNFDIIKGDIGHVWCITPEHPATKHLQRQGYLEEEWDDFTSISWLEYAIRVATQSLRPIDMYYEPYDQKGPQAEWGKRVLEKYMDNDQVYGEDEDEDELLMKVPWLVWERELKQPKMDMTSSLAQLLGALAGR